ncbi:MAG TPA: DUF1697 domain-containing protein [Bryobacterales bacterium]|nr:DUF1697 domain-containing protein [Bryobacterales bacterium]
MAVVISLLRGVNVGGHNQIRMEALRALCGSLGLRDAQTYVQSGNVVFRTDARDLVRLAKRMEGAIEASLGFRPVVVVRTCAELRGVIARNPFAARREIDPRKLVVNFLAADPGPEARQRLLRVPAGPEELHLAGRELYIYFPDGVGLSKLSPAVLEKALQTSATGRNWNSVTKLLEIAERLEAS